MCTMMHDVIACLTPMCDDSTTCHDCCFGLVVRLSLLQGVTAAADGPPPDLPSPEDELPPGTAAGPGWLSMVVVLLQSAGCSWGTVKSGLLFPAAYTGSCPVGFDLFHATWRLSCSKPICCLRTVLQFIVASCRPCQLCPLNEKVLGAGCEGQTNC
jgi:hypothetical protein